MSWATVNGGSNRVISNPGVASQVFGSVVEHLIVTPPAVSVGSTDGVLPKLLAEVCAIVPSGA